MPSKKQDFVAIRRLDKVGTFVYPRDGSSFVVDVELVDSVHAAASRDDSRVRMPTYIACVCVLLVVAFVHLSSAVLIC
jgi:hypothetical protein